MSTEDKMMGGLLILVLALLASVVLAVALNVDSMANCERSCHGKMASYTESQRYGASSLVPMCQCAP